MAKGNIIFKTTPDNHTGLKMIALRRGIAYQYILEAFVDLLIVHDKGEKNRLMKS